jgi:beta-glucosidase
MFRFALALIFSLVATAQSARVDPAKINALLERMTLEEKIGQLTQIGGIAFIPDKLTPEERIRRGQAGSILWVNDPVAINRLQRIAVEESRLKIPLIFGLDVIHGFRTIFPMPLALASSWDMRFIERVQAAAAREARAAGIQWTFAPMVDIARDPRWGRLIEGAGEDPFLGAAVAAAQVRGFQGTDVSSPDHVIACAKHFAGYGAADGGRDYDSAYIPEERMWNVYLPPFKAALDAGVATFMSAYMDLNDVPATANPFLLQSVLRETWKFRGFVVSDANSVKDLETHGFARNPEEAAFRAFTAGVDMDMASRTYLDHLPDLVKSGKVPAASIDDAVRRILAVKQQLGLFDSPYADEARTKQVLADPATRRLAREAAAHSAVLLKNEGNVLPLDKSLRRSIAVIGPLADSPRDLLSMWAGFGVDLSSTPPIVDGIRKNAGSAATVSYAPGVQIAKRYPSMFEGIMGVRPVAPWTAAQRESEFNKAVALAQSSDLVVLVLGEQALMSGELASQSSLELPGDQQKLLHAVAGAGKPTVLVLVNGRPLDISWAAEHVPAILVAWHPGNEGANGIADVLFGDAAPAGRLPLSWPRNAGQIPVYYAHNRTHQPEEAPEFKSRYWDSPSSPLYPFGYGLTYTSFKYSNLRVAQSEVKPGNTVDVSVDIENTGRRAGDEVAQLYIHQRAGSASRPVRELKGFERISLSPGEKKTVRYRLGPAELSYWNGIQRKWIQDAAAFDVWAGPDATAQLHTTFAVAGN